MLNFQADNIIQRLRNRGLVGEEKTKSIKFNQQKILINKLDLHQQYLIPTFDPEEGKKSLMKHVTICFNTGKKILPAPLTQSDIPRINSFWCYHLKMLIASYVQCLYFLRESIPIPQVYDVPKYPDPS